MVKNCVRGTHEQEPESLPRIQTRKILLVKEVSIPISLIFIFKVSFIREISQIIFQCDTRLYIKIGKRAGIKQMLYRTQ